MLTKRIFSVVTLMIGLWAIGVGSVHAQADKTQALGSCLVDSLNGKERKALAKWMFFAMAEHPDLNKFAQFSSQVKDDTDQYIGDLITRLIVEDCAKLAVSAQKENPMAIESAFRLVGEVAMQEIMTNGEVMKSISAYFNYADQQAIAQLFSEATD